MRSVLAVMGVVCAIGLSSVSHADQTGGAVDKPAAEVKAMTAHEQPLPPFPSQSGAGIYGKSTGFFHVEKIGGKWWVIDPAGTTFYIIGTDHVNYNVHWCEALGYAPYHKNCEAIYGDEQKWADHAVERLVSWGFNSLGANSSPTTRRRGLAHMEFLGMGADFSSIDCITEKTFWTGFPNVFSPKFEAYCDEKAKERCAPHKADMWLIGYFIDNELEWFGKTGSLLRDTLKLPSEHTAKIALVNLMRTRYKGDIQSFNKVWGTKLASFDDMLKLTEAPRSADKRAEDDDFAYSKLCADRYFAVTTAAIRKHDPNHMVLGCRFAGRSPGVWSVVGKYCDIVSVNCYRTLDLERGILTDDFEKDLATWHTATKRPLMITEWSFPGLDAGLPSVHGAGQRVRTQADRARAFTIFQKLLFATPFVVGSDYFMWVDEPALGISKAFPEDSNYGLVDVNDKAYKPITEAATKLHARAYDIHSGNVADVYAKPSGKRGEFIVGNSGKAGAKCTVTTWVDGAPTTRTMELAGGASQRIDALQGRKLYSGGHLLMCKVEQSDSFVEPDPADNEAHDLFYVSEPSERRIPVLVANLTGSDMENVPVSIKLSDLRMTGGRDASTTNPVGGTFQVHMKIPSMLLSGDCLIFQTQKVWSRHCVTYYVYPGASRSDEQDQQGSKLFYEPRNKGFRAGNGILEFVNEGTSGNAFDKVLLNGVEVGSFMPLIYQQTGQNFWVRPSALEKIDVHRSPIALVLDITFVYNGDPAYTSADRPHKYRAAYRFTIYPEKPYYTSRFLWIENTDTQPWKLGSYFHYVVSKIAGDASNDQPRSRYWIDEKAGLCYGVQSPSGFLTNMWKDEAGEEHADVVRLPYLDRTLRPAERFTTDDEPVYVIAGTEDAFECTSRQVSDTSGLVVKVCRP